uniref:Uncharacterized protein n=1 Tax=Tanacetum cinerariifolium TaxID=118510 RepID=A0A699RHL0_TANCI|nr:hypothetical protein [Tanacetum cinerariifolium]
MLKLTASQEGLEVWMTDDDIIDKAVGTSRWFNLGRGRKLPNNASSSSFCSYPASSPSTSKAALARFVEAYNEQMKDIFSQLANKNIDVLLPIPLDPNHDASYEGGAHEDDAEPGDE